MAESSRGIRRRSAHRVTDGACHTLQTESQGRGDSSDGVPRQGSRAGILHFRRESPWSFWLLLGCLRGRRSPTGRATWPGKRSGLLVQAVQDFKDKAPHLKLCSKYHTAWLHRPRNKDMLYISIPFFKNLIIWIVNIFKSVYIVRFIIRDSHVAYHHWHKLGVKPASGQFANPVFQ